MIRLDTSIESDLKWSVREPIEGGVDWFLDFGFAEKLPLFDQKGPLSSYLVAIGEFLRCFWDEESEVVKSIYLYRGSLSQACSMVWTQNFEEDFQSWKQQQRLTKNLRQFYSMHVFSEYLHHLGSVLPDTLEARAFFQVSGDESPSFLAQMLSLEHFPYLKIEVQGHPYLSCESKAEATVGVVFPPLAYVRNQTFCEIDGLLEVLTEKRIPFRLIPESHLTEEWCGLDDLILFSKDLSLQGIRKARGFVAAGGQLVWVGEGAGLDREVSIETFLKSRGRGI